MARDEKWLELRRKRWYCVMAVPRDLWAALKPYRRLIRSLQTESYHIAIARRHAVLAEFQRKFEDARRKIHPDPVVTAALEWREGIGRLEAGDLSRFGTSLPLEDGQTRQEQALAIAYSTVDDEAHLIEHGESVDFFGQEIVVRPTGNPAGAKAFRDIATGHATPLQPLLEPWLAELDIGATSKRDHRLSVKLLLEWTQAERLAPTIESFDRRTAGRYVSHLLTSGLDRSSTLTKRLWSLSRLWAWLQQKGYTDQQPWRGHELSRSGKSQLAKEKERPFTPEELRALLDGGAGQPLHDIMRLALLSGARERELVMLRVRDIDLSDRTMALISDPKTPSSRRVVPVHSAIWEAVRGRTVGKAPDTFVFSDMGRTTSPVSRGNTLAKNFGRYRVQCGIDDRAPGQRRALTNFHSCRRSFITACEQAGQPESTIRAVAGHNRAGMTFGVYSAGPSLDQRRACVEAVRLPG
jgi:integrase